MNNFVYSIVRLCCLKSCAYWSRICNAVLVDTNWNKVGILNTECDNLILCSFSNSTGSSAELFYMCGALGLKKTGLCKCDHLDQEFQ